jgi:hypothetical protein
MEEETTPAEIIASFPKNAREAVCAGLNEWKGKKRLFVRIFTPTLEPGTMLPTKEGIALSVEHAPALLEAVRALAAAPKDKEQVVAKISKNTSQQVWAGVSLYKGMTLVYLRTYAQFGDDETLKPTKQGISLRAEQCPKLLEIVEKLAAACG